MEERHGNENWVFFKYMTPGTGRIVLSNTTLRWSIPGTLNDPYDMQFDLHIEVDREAAKARALDKLWQSCYGAEPIRPGNPLGMLINILRDRFPRLSREDFEHEFGAAFDEGFDRMMAALPWMQAQTRAIVKRTKILCLTKSPENPLMWAHYAEQHKGVVLGFRSVEGLDSPWCMAKPIQYVENMPRLLDEEFLSDLGSGRASINPETLLNRLIYTKSAEWVYEREWRISSGLGRNVDAPHEDIPFHPLELDAVILGCRLSDDDREWFTAHTAQAYPHARVFQIVRSPDRFQLSIEPI